MIPLLYGFLSWVILPVVCRYLLGDEGGDRKTECREKELQKKSGRNAEIKH